MNNNLDQFSDEELDLITNYLLKSAKTRFNYEKFKKELSHFDEEFIDYNILLKLITSKSIDATNERITLEILSDIMLSGYLIEKDDILNMIAQKEKELALEILCSKIAMESLQNGVHPIVVIQQISQLL